MQNRYFTNFKKLIVQYQFPMKISENSRVWIYQSDRILSSEEVKQIQEKLDGFTSQWLAHGHELLALAEIRYNQFIIISVDEQQVGAMKTPHRTSGSSLFRCL